MQKRCGVAQRHKVVLAVLLAGGSLVATSHEHAITAMHALEFSDSLMREFNGILTPHYVKSIAAALGEVRPLVVRQMRHNARECASALAEFFAMMQEHKRIIMPLMQESFKKRDLQFGSSKLCILAEAGNHEGMLLSYLENEQDKKALYGELRVVLEDMWANRSRETVEAYIVWLRGKMPESQQLLSGSHMKHLDRIMVPRGVEEMHRLVMLAKKIDRIIASYRAKMLEHHIASKAHHVSTDAEAAFLAKIRKPLLDPLREALGYIHMFRSTLYPLAEQSFAMHDLPIECSLLQTFFEQQPEEVESFFVNHIRTINDLDQLAIEFTVLDQDLIHSLSPRTMDNYRSWKDNQKKQQGQG